jgi:hypothetical protein
MTVAIACARIIPVIPVSRVVDHKKELSEKRRAEEEERHKGSLPPPLKI